MFKYLVFILFLVFNKAASANECPETLRLDHIVESAIVNSEGRQVLEYSAPSRYQENEQLGFFIFLKYEEKVVEDYDAYIRPSLDSINGYSTAKFLVPSDYKTEDPWPKFFSVVLKVMYVPDWEEKDKFLADQCISALGEVNLKRNDF